MGVFSGTCLPAGQPGGSLASTQPLSGAQTLPVLTRRPVAESLTEELPTKTKRIPSHLAQVHPGYLTGSSEPSEVACLHFGGLGLG